MTEALSPPMSSPTLAHHMQTADTTDPRRSASPKSIARDPRPQARERIPSYAQNRMSAYSQRTSRSRPQSNVYAPFQSSLSYTFVRDFAYAQYHPMHYGPPPESASGATTPGSDWNPGRRASDSAEAVNGHFPHGAWTAGPWGGDGALYGEPQHEMESLPSTSFAATEPSESPGIYGKGRHRKSKSYASISDFERGRRRESGHGGGGGGGSRDTTDIFYFSSGASPSPHHTDPAGRESLRLSRGFFPTTTTTTNPSPSPSSGTENNNNNNNTTTTGSAARRDSRYNDTTLPPRSFHTSQMIDTESDLPLDAEYSTQHQHSPQRESLGPEDEELFAGPSLALYNFEPENPNELRLVEGQTILVSYRHGQGWLVAEDPQTGEQGLVPEEYVRLLRDIDGWDAERGGFIEDEDEEGEREEGEESLIMDATAQLENGDTLHRLAQRA